MRYYNAEELAFALGFAEMIDGEDKQPLKISYSAKETLHGRDWGHECDFQFDDECGFDDECEYIDDLPF